MEKSLEEKVSQLTEDFKSMKEKIDVLFYNTVALDSLTKFMLLNQNQLIGDMAMLNDVLKQLTDMLDEKAMASQYEDSDDADDFDDVEESDGDDDDPVGSLN
jgi:hypothetical protein